jgi:hypothetical protein
LNKPCLLVFLSVLGSFLAIVACGKKAPPFLSENRFSAGVTEFTAEWDKGEIFLKGFISPVPGSGGIANRIKGARVYYAQYPLEDTPCAECPIEFHGFDTFGQEVIAEGDFVCRVPRRNQGKVYFFKVHLINAQDAMGPPSNTVKVVVE